MHSKHRSFGLVFTGFFFLNGLAPLRHGLPIRGWALGLSSVLLIVTLIAPALLEPFAALWRKIGLLISQVTQPVMSAILFFVAVTPVAFILRLFRSDPLLLKLDPEAASYWIDRDQEIPPSSFENPF